MIVDVPPGLNHPAVIFSGPSALVSATVTSEGKDDLVCYDDSGKLAGRVSFIVPSGVHKGSHMGNTPMPAFAYGLVCKGTSQSPGVRFDIAEPYATEPVTVYNSTDATNSENANEYDSTSRYVREYTQDAPRDDSFLAFVLSGLFLAFPYIVAWLLCGLFAAALYVRRAIRAESAGDVVLADFIGLTVFGLGSLIAEFASQEFWDHPLVVRHSRSRPGYYTLDHFRNELRKPATKKVPRRYPNPPPPIRGKVTFYGTPPR
jgi:hypothetical protein